MINAWALAILAYQGNQEMPMPIMTLLREGPKTAVINIGKINGGKARKLSEILIITSSIQPFSRPATIPRGIPIRTAIRIYRMPTFKEDMPA